MVKRLKSAIADAPTPKELAAYDMNDYGNALRLIRLCGGSVDAQHNVDKTHVTLLFLRGYGWVGYNGKYWDKTCGEQIARRLAHLVAIKLHEAVNEIVKKTDKSDSKVLEFAERSGQSGASSAMLKQAEAYLTVDIDAFDQLPMTLNCNNGTVWLTDEKGRFLPKLQPHRPADRLTRFIDFDYDPKAVAEEFDATLCDALPETDKRAFFHRAMAYTATGDIREQAYFLCQGLGRDGKSTLLNAVRGSLGGYGGVGDVKTFLDIGQQGASSASPDLAKLAGDVRLVVLSEPPRDGRLNESLIKQWTGGDPVQARELREKPFEFIPVGKLWLQCNAFPVAKGNDDGIWRRTLPILFENQVPPEKVDRLLPERLKREKAGILNWLIAGVGEWLRQGLDPPECVTRARDEYRAQSSPFMDWLQERCVYGKAAGSATTAAKALYDDYKEWAENQGTERPMTTTGFGKAMSERQIKRSKRHGVIFRGPIRLKTAAELEADGQKPEASLAFGASATGSTAGHLNAPTPFDSEDEKW